MTHQTDAFDDTINGLTVTLSGHPCNYQDTSVGASTYTVRVLVVFLSIPQSECHPALPQKEVRAFCKDHGIYFQAYTSLGRGQVRLIRVQSRTFRSLQRYSKLQCDQQGERGVVGVCP